MITATRTTSLITLAALALGLSAATAAAATLRYSEGDGTLADLKDRLSPGDTLLVPPGRWKVTETLLGGVTLLGEGPADSCVFEPYIPSAPMFLFQGGGGVSRVRGLTFDCGDEQEATGLYFIGAELDVRDCTFLGGKGLQADSCGGAVVGCRFGKCKSGLSCKDSDFDIDQCELLGCRGSISVRGSTNRITRNRIISLNTGISIVGKRFAPVIGGKPGMGNVLHGGFNSDVFTAGGQDVNAQYNYWGIKSTSEMNSRGYPADIDAIFDGWNHEKKAGYVDYRNWLDAPNGKPVSPTDPLVRYRTQIIIGGAVLLALLLLVFGRRRKTA